MHDVETIFATFREHSLFKLQYRIKLKLYSAYPVLGHIYSNKKETSDFHGTVYFDPVKISQQK